MNLKNILKMCCNRIYSCKVILAAMTLLVLFVSVIVRLIVTIKPGFDITFNMPTLVLPGVSPKYAYWEPVTPSQVCYLCIWLSMTYLSCSLIWEITRFTGFFRPIIFAAFHDFRQNIALLSLHSYEIWMFAFIYKTYVTEFDYIFQIIIKLPLITLLFLTIFQMTWAQDVTPDDRGHLQELQYYAITSLVFSATMAFHVVCMGFTNYMRTKDVVLGDGDLTDMYLFLLGVAEILYRAHFIYKNYCLISMYRNPPTPPGEEAVHDGGDGQPVMARMPAPVAAADRRPADNEPEEFTYQAAIMVVGVAIFDAIVIRQYFQW